MTHSTKGMTMPKFDVRCKICGHTAVVKKGYHDPHECSTCGEPTITLMPGAGVLVRKQPYDYLEGPIPDAKKIKSFAHDRRKGGK